MKIIKKTYTKKFRKPDYNNYNDSYDWLQSQIRSHNHRFAIFLFGETETLFNWKLKKIIEQT